MKYKSSDIIVCFPGIGRTYFTGQYSNSSFVCDLDQNKEWVEEFLKKPVILREERTYRYILIPASPDIFKELKAQKIPFIYVRPYNDEANEWMKRWMKADANISDLTFRRLAFRWDNPVDVPIVYLSSEEWLGNVLSQSPTGEE